MPYHDGIRGIFTSERGWQLIEVSLIILAGFVALDYFIVHPFIFDNAPTPFYFTIKPLVVGIGLVGVSWWLMSKRNVSQWTAVFVGGFVGVIYLQLYYTLYPIPLIGGEQVQVGFVGNFTQGLPIHFGMLAIAAVIVYVVYTRPWEGDDD